MSLLLAHSTLINPLRQALSAARSRYSQPELERVEEFVGTFLGERPFRFPVPGQQPELGYFPGLTPRPFFDDQSWMKPLEAHAPGIREELCTRLAEQRGFQPYFAEGDAAFRKARFGEGLKDAQDWTVAMLSFGGVRQESAALFPRTMAAFDDCFPGHGTGTHEISYAALSAIKPGSHVPPHYGLCNFKLTGHLGLIVPDGRCEIRVGTEVRSWAEGKAMAFDDTYEHEVWQEASGLRVVLLFWVWHPDLTAVEVAVLKTLIAATRRVLATTGVGLSYFVGQA